MEHSGKVSGGFTTLSVMLQTLTFARKTDNTLFLALSLALSGLRETEIIQLRWENVKLEEGRIEITNSKYRPELKMIKLSRAVIKILSNRKQTVMDVSEFLLTSKGGKKLNHVWIRKHLVKIANELELPRFKLDDFYRESWRLRVDREVVRPFFIFPPNRPTAYYVALNVDRFLPASKLDIELTKKTLF